MRPQRARLVGTIFVALLQSACFEHSDSGLKSDSGLTEDASLSGSVVELSGRVFSLDNGAPLAGAEIQGPGAEATTSDQKGAYSLSFPESESGSVKAQSKGAAPVSKPAPKKKANLELHMKALDASQEIDVGQGGEVKTKKGAGLSVSKDALEGADGAVIKKVTLSVAAPDSKKANGLAAVPGNFDAKRGSQKGRLSAEAPLYAGAVAGEQTVKVKAGKKLKLSVPVPGPIKKASKKMLYRYDEATGIWLEAAEVEVEVGEDGTPVYTGEVENLGWFAVGEFYDALTCLRGCVEDDAGAAAGARIVVNGLDHFSQITSYADEDGCFALDVRAAAEVAVSAQVAGGVSEARLVQTSADAMSASDDAAACTPLGTLRIEQAPSDCPLGLAKCGALCVDLSFDAEHCGGCGTVCADTCVAGACEDPNFADAGGTQPELDAGAMQPEEDAGRADPVADAGIAFPDASTSVPVEAGTIDLDLDGDGVEDIEDNCPTFANAVQSDKDQDGVGDACDNCPTVSNPKQETVACIDSDNDQVIDTLDNCPLNHNPIQNDTDGDTVGDPCDNCPLVANVTQNPAVCADAGTGTVDAGTGPDNDGDGIEDLYDNCPSVYNPTQEPTACMDPDVDGDGVLDANDNCPYVYDQTQSNGDEDTFGDACDNCPTVYNPGQEASACADLDNDGVFDSFDNCPNVNNSSQADYDTDSVGDSCDNCPTTANFDQADADSDGVGDMCEG